MDGSLQAAAPTSQLEKPQPAPSIRLGKQRVQVRRASSGGLLSGGQLVIAALVAYAFVTRTIAAATVPPWQSPDEPKHFEYVRTLIDKREELWAQHRLLTLNDGQPWLQQEILQSLARYHFWESLGLRTPDPLPADFNAAFGVSPSQLHRPSLYYDLGAPVMLPLQDQKIETQLLAMRLVSAVLSALSILPAYAIGRLVAPRDTYVPIACAALVAMLPMGIFIGGMMSVDNLLLLEGAAAVLLMTRGVVSGFNWRTWLLLLSCVLLGLLTKRGAVILLPAVLVCCLIAFFRLRWATRAWVLGGFGVPLALATFATMTNLIGRSLPTEAFMSTLVAYSLNSPSQWDNLLKVPLGSEQTWQIVGVELDWYFKSFWGVFALFSIAMAPWVYTALLWITGVCGLGCVGWMLGRGPDQKQRLILLVLYSTLILTALVAGVAERLAYYSFGEIPQGRYLFVVLGAIGALYAVGLRTWFPERRLGTAVPSIVLIGSLVALDAYAYFGAILPFYARSFT